MQLNSANLYRCQSILQSRDDFGVINRLNRFTVTGHPSRVLILKYQEDDVMLEKFFIFLAKPALKGSICCWSSLHEGVVSKKKPIDSWPKPSWGGVSHTACSCCQRKWLSSTQRGVDCPCTHFLITTKNISPPPKEKNTWENPSETRGA